MTTWNPPPSALETASPLAFVGEHRAGRETTVDGSFDTSVVATAILAALDAAGYVVVQREPTEGMIPAAGSIDFPYHDIRDDRAMIAAQESKP